MTGMETTPMERSKRRARLLPTAGLPNKLRKLRIARDMTMPALAKEIGVTRQALQQAETHGSGIGKEKWYQLADLFNIDPRILETP